MCELSFQMPAPRSRRATNRIQPESKSVRSCAVDTAWNRVLAPSHRRRLRRGYVTRPSANAICSAPHSLPCSAHDLPPLLDMTRIYPVKLSYGREDIQRTMACLANRYQNIAARPPWDIGFRRRQAPAARPRAMARGGRAVTSRKPAAATVWRVRGRRTRSIRPPSDRAGDQCGTTRPPGR